MPPRQVDRLKPLFVKKVAVPGYYADGDGLYLQVSKALTKSWIFRYTLAGRSREMGLGSTRTLTLAEAREASRNARKMLLTGLDPIDDRKAQRAASARQRESAVTFEKCADEFIKSFGAKWRSVKHRGQWESTLAQHVYPIFGKELVESITTDRVMAALKPIWHEIPETASRVRQRVEKILDWAKGMGYRSGDNPAAWKGNLEALLPKRDVEATRQHHAALPYPEIEAFLAAARKMDGMAAVALEFTILTAARTREVTEARWSEFDFEEKLWTIPKSRMKAKREHRVPLSQAAIDLIESQPRVGEYVFPGRSDGKAASDMLMLQLLKRMQRTDVTVHGFRSTFRDWAGEQTAYPREVIEHALAHGLRDATEAAYQRGDLLRKRTLLMDDWATYCTTPRPAKAKVSPIRKKA